MQLLKWAAVELKPIKRTALKAVVSARHSGRRFMTHFNVLDAWRCQSETTRNVSTAKNSFDVYKVVTPSLPSANIWIITLKECFSLSLFTNRRGSNLWGEEEDKRYARVERQATNEFSRACLVNWPMKFQPERNLEAFDLVTVLFLSRFACFSACCAIISYPHTFRSPT